MVEKLVGDRCQSFHFSKYFARVGEKLRRNVIDSLCYSKELDRILCTRVHRIVSRTAGSFLLLANRFEFLLSWKLSTRLDISFFISR